MFENIQYTVEYYTWIYKRTILQQAFLSYVNKKISYEDYYDHYNKDYFDLLFLFNYKYEPMVLAKHL